MTAALLGGWTCTSDSRLSSYKKNREGRKKVLISHCWRQFVRMRDGQMERAQTCASLRGWIGQVFHSWRLQSIARNAKWHGFSGILVCLKGQGKVIHFECTFGCLQGLLLQPEWRCPWKAVHREKRNLVKIPCFQIFFFLPALYNWRCLLSRNRPLFHMGKKYIDYWEIQITRRLLPLPS